MVGTESRVSCEVCPRTCSLAEGQTGACGARACRGGRVVPVNYGSLTALALDPVEKKPLAMWNPGTTVLSVGSFGCNLRCPFCQNHDIARARKGDLRVREVSPEQLVDAALRLRSNGCVGIAYTYNEPLVSWEYVRDTAQLAHEAGLVNVAVTNGMIGDAVLDELLPLLDAVNIDLKGFSAQFYALCLGVGEGRGSDVLRPGTAESLSAEPCGGDAKLVLGQRAFDAVRNAIARAAAEPTCHVEVTTLVVPDGETPETLEHAAQWLASIDPDIPYHVTQYHPAYRWSHVPALPNRKVHAVADTARKYLNHVFTGNM